MISQIKFIFITLVTFELTIIVAITTHNSLNSTVLSFLICQKEIIILDLWIYCCIQDRRYAIFVKCLYKLTTNYVVVLIMVVAAAFVIISSLWLSSSTWRSFDLKRWMFPIANYPELSGLKALSLIILEVWMLEIQKWVLQDENPCLVRIVFLWDA